MSVYKTGPWNADGRAVYADDGQVIAVFSHDGATFYQDVEAAFLAAAARDLLAALEACVEHGIFPSSVQSVRDTARAAIAKARGES